MLSADAPASAGHTGLAWPPDLMCLMTLPRSETLSTVLPDSLELVVSSSRSSGLEDVSDLTLTRLGGAALLVAPDVEICTNRNRLSKGGTGGMRRGSK